MEANRELTDLEKLQLFFRAWKSKVDAGDIVANVGEAPPHVQVLVHGLERRWQSAKKSALGAPPEKAAAILDEYAAPLFERLDQGQADIEQSFLAGEDIEERIRLWGILYVYKDRSLDLAEELGLSPKTKESELPDSAEAALVDGDALRSYHAAMELSL